MTNDETPTRILTYEDLMQGRAAIGIANVRPCIEVLQDMIVEETNPETRKELEQMLRKTIDDACPF